jgi:hypothetical protein
MENTELASDKDHYLAKLKYDYELARLGLKGTLWGAWASIFLILVITIAEVSTNRFVVQGWPYTAMFAVATLSVTIYGAFIFNRALKITAGAKKMDVVLGPESHRHDHDASS